MTIPYHLDPTLVPRKYSRTLAVVDVATIISDVRAQLVTGLGWSEPSTALFQTPVDAAGRFMDVLLTRVVAGTLEWRVRDQNAAVICTRRINIDTVNGVVISYFSSIYGIYVENYPSAENACAFVLDKTPDGQGDDSIYVAGSGLRNTSGTDDGQGNTVGKYFMLDNGVATSRARPRRRDVDLSNSINYNMWTPSGTWLFTDMYLSANYGGAWRFSGRICHAICLDATFGYGTVVKVNIDDNTQAPFKVVYLGGFSNMRMAMRVD